MKIHKFLLPFAMLSVLILAGAGCDIFSTKYGPYTKIGSTENGVDKYNDISIATASSRFSSPNGSSDVVIYSADSSTVNQYLDFLLKDQTGDKQGFTKMDIGQSTVNYRSADGKLCLFIWTSGSKMVMINNAECSPEDALITTFVKKYPPS